jgi:hypothetical protein
MASARTDFGERSMTTLLTANFNNALPAPPAGKVNVKWQADPAANYPRNISAYVDPPGTSGSVAVVYVVTLAPGSPGNFTVAHGAPSTPTFALIEMTSNGTIWLQSPTSFDATNLYLTASAGSITGKAYVWVSPADAIVPFTSAAGNFTVAHPLGATPVIGLIELEGGGTVWFQNPTAYDSSNVYLTGSAAGIIGNVILWKAVPNLTTSDHASIALAPGAAGNFQVAHGLGVTPTVCLLRMTSSGSIWFQSLAADSTYIYLTASSSVVTGVAELWTGGGGGGGGAISTITVLSIPSTSAGNFTIAHGAPATPKAVVMEMTSAGAIWFQSPTEYDGTNLYLTASDAGLTASAKVFT